MNVQSILPPRTSTPFLREYEQAIAYDPRVANQVDTIRDIKGRQLPGWLEYLLYEYGLLELTAFVPNAYTLLSEGRQWQIERDTFAAVARGLGWVGAPATIVEAKTVNFWWNNFQLYLYALPAADYPTLDRIEGIAKLSSPFHSDFRRGVQGYDAPALTADDTKLDGSMLDDDSGVRLRTGGPKWSFGRAYEFDHLLTEAEGVSVGIWLENVTTATYSLTMNPYNPASVEVPRLLTLGVETLTLSGTDLSLGTELAGTGGAGEITFTRASEKWAQTLTGSWTHFLADQLATTDKGTLLEPAADRLCPFEPQSNALAGDVAAAIVNLVNVPDPFGTANAIRVTFDGNAGNVFLVPASGLVDGGVYSTSFFCKLITVTGSVSSTLDDAGFTKFFSQLVLGQWVRVIGPPVTVSNVDGQWLDITLPVAGVSMVVELYGFQIEAGTKVTSPIVGAGDTGHRDADVLTLLLPSGLNSVNFEFDDGSRQPFPRVVGPYLVDPAALERSLVVAVNNLTSGSWTDMTFPWTDAPFSWVSDAGEQRRVYLAGLFSGQPAYIALKNAVGGVIGYRRARAVKQVRKIYEGSFVFGGDTYSSATAGNTLLIEAMTDAGNGVGQDVKGVELVFGATPAPGQKPGALWLPAGGLVGGHSIAPALADVSLRATVREYFKFLLRF